METSKSKQIWKYIFELVCNYKKALSIIFICLIYISITTFLQPLLLKDITDKGIINKNYTQLCVLVLFLFFIKISSSGVNIVQTKSFAQIHNGISETLHKKMFCKLYRLPLSYFKENNGAEIVSTMKADIGVIASVSDEVAALSISSILQVCAGLIGLMIVNWKMALGILIVIPIKYIIVSMFSKKKSEILRQSLDKDYKYCTWLGEQIDGIREMKLWNLFPPRYSDLKEMLKKIVFSYKENVMWDRYYSFCEEFLDAIIYCGLYLLGGWLVLKNSMTLGGVLAFVSYCNYIMAPITLLINIRYYFAKVKPSAMRFYDCLNLPEEKFITAKEDEKEILKAEPVIAFEHVKFSYNGKDLLLKDVTFNVYKGEKIALIGPNGAGKSTILDLLLGIYQPDEGIIKIDGNAINDLGMERVRDRIAIVNQKIYLYNTTIENNINIEGKAENQELEKVCLKSGVSQFVEKFPDGYQQVLGKDGAKLSGGEKQKIAVARALLKKADIVLLDEATNNYDMESRIVSMCEIFQDRTVVMITHSYDELQDVSRVYQLHDGKLLEKV